MDVLADILAAVRVGQARSFRTEARAPWGLWFSGLSGAGFHVVLRGSCWLLRPDRPPLRLAEGDVVFLRYRDRHGLADEPGRELLELGPPGRTGATALGTVLRDGPGAATVLLCGAYLFDRDLAHPLLAALPEVIHLPARAGRYPALDGAVALLGDEVTAAAPGAAAAVPGLVDVLLVYILRAWLAEHPDTGWSAALVDPAVAGAVGAIHTDPGGPWTVTGLAALVGLSRAAFARRFTALVGEPPVGYLTRWRMITAARLLRGTDDPLRSVARRSGYASPYAFAKAFRRAYGQPPGRYRVESGRPAPTTG